MTDHFLERLADGLDQRLFDYDRKSQGKEPYPLHLTKLHRDEYAADARRIMAVIGPLLAEVAAYEWPGCGQRLAGGPLVCRETGEHLAHVFEASAGSHDKASEVTEQ